MPHFSRPAFSKANVLAALVFVVVGYSLYVDRGDMVRDFHQGFVDGSK